MNLLFLANSYISWIAKLKPIFELTLTVNYTELTWLLNSFEIINISSKRIDEANLFLTIRNVAILWSFVKYIIKKNVSWSWYESH